MTTQDDSSARKLAYDFGYSLGAYLGECKATEKWMTKFGEEFGFLANPMNSGYAKGSTDVSRSKLPGIIAAHLDTTLTDPEAILKNQLECWDDALEQRAISPEDYFERIATLAQERSNPSKVYSHILSSKAALPYKRLQVEANQAMLDLVDNPQTEEIRNLKANFNKPKKSPEEISEFVKNVNPKKIKELFNLDMSGCNEDNRALRLEITQNLDGYLAYFEDTPVSRFQQDGLDEYLICNARGYCLALSYVEGQIGVEQLRKRWGLGAHPDQFTAENAFPFRVELEGAEAALEAIEPYKNLALELGSKAWALSLRENFVDVLGLNIANTAMAAYYADAISRPQLLSYIEEACGPKREFAATAYQKAQKMALVYNDVPLHSRFFLCEQREKVRQQRVGEMTPSYHSLLNDYTRTVSIAQARGYITDWEARGFMQETFQSGRGYSRHRTAQTLGLVSSVGYTSPNFLNPNLNIIRQKASQDLRTLDSSKSARAFLTDSYGPTDLHGHLSSLMFAVEDLQETQSVEVDRK